MKPIRIVFNRPDRMTLLVAMAVVMSSLFTPTVRAASATDSTPPTVTLRVFEFRNSRYIFDVDSSDSFGIAQVAIAINGAVVQSRIHKPWWFELTITTPTPFEVCAEAMDRSGNVSSRDCTVIPGPNPCHSRADCASGQYCYRPAFRCSGVGACEDIPLICAGPPDLPCCPVPDWALTCGCDGREYAGYCEPAREGVNVAHPGRCN